MDYSFLEKSPKYTPIKTSYNYIPNETEFVSNINCSKKLFNQYITEEWDLYRDNNSTNPIPYEYIPVESHSQSEYIHTVNGIPQEYIPKESHSRSEYIRSTNGIPKEYICDVRVANAVPSEQANEIPHGYIRPTDSNSPKIHLHTQQIFSPKSQPEIPVIENKDILDYLESQIKRIDNQNYKSNKKETISRVQKKEKRKKFYIKRNTLNPDTFLDIIKRGPFIYPDHDDSKNKVLYIKPLLRPIQSNTDDKNDHFFPLNWIPIYSKNESESFKKYIRSANGIHSEYIPLFK